MERFINCVYKIVFGRTLAVVLMIALQILVLVGSFTYLGIKYPFVWETMNFLGGVVIIYIKIGRAHV